MNFEAASQAKRKMRELATQAHAEIDEAQERVQQARELVEGASK